MKVSPERIRLARMTPEMYDEYLKEYENDPDLWADKSRYVPYEYSKERTARYVAHQAEPGRIPLAILCDGDIAGEIILKNIEPRVCATMGIALKNARYKDRGIGTQAEKLAVRYVFHDLDIPVLYADTIRTNTRSQHVLEKVGFVFIREADGFRYYEIRREPDGGPDRKTPALGENK